MRSTSLASVSTLIVALWGLLGSVSANTPLTDEFVRKDLKENGGLEMAYASRPLWHFAESRDYRTCYPTPAFNVNGAQHGLQPAKWPNAGDDCVDPGPKGASKVSFPTYYTVTQCWQDEIRVVYNLYYQKDGWSDVIFANGHMHDWERIIVIWKKNMFSGNWTRASLLKSYHSGYMEDSWARIQNTFNDDNEGEQNGKNKDHAKIYIGWGKHAMFSDRNTGFNDKISQGCQREFRSRDWWYNPKKVDLVLSGRNTTVGDKIASVNWGKADSSPPVVEDRVCSEKKGGFISC
ncbi:hypothetical protein BJ508DRAFT_419523 [Ascobolus immersus RN42]|uniref:NPP1-domain-containing protein n=1 Tax=Ascobolus immersus RN42 TaxID=1160509 RepID=A0A3N4HDI3_ASCIM|nr:hypothetical protein BJ508DRAFT_419523 [Ascobolus immersus RN42]